MIELGPAWSYVIEPRISPDERAQLAVLGVVERRGRWYMVGGGVLGYGSLNTTRRLLRHLLRLGIAPTPRQDGGYITTGTSRDGRAWSWANMARHPIEVDQHGV